MDGGKYAVFKIRHTSEAVQKAWDGIFPELARQEIAIDECRPVLERPFLFRFRSAPNG